MCLTAERRHLRPTQICRRCKRLCRKRSSGASSDREMERAQSTDQCYFERLLSKSRRPAMQGRSQALSQVSLFYVQLRIRLSIVTLLVALLIFRPGLAEATVWIANDPGGSIVRYIYRYERLRATNQKNNNDNNNTTTNTNKQTTIPPGR